MVNVHIIITKKKDLEYMNVMHGMIIHCIDTKDTFYINESRYKLDISRNAIILNELIELDSVISPILSRIYIVKENKKAYKYTNKWVVISDENDLLNIVEGSIDYTPSLLIKNGEAIAPKALASSTYLSDGTKLSTVLDNNFITISKTKSIYIEAEIHRQRIFNIPYPVSNFNLCQNHMAIIFRGKQLESDEYVVNADKLILNLHGEPVKEGELLLFIFFYNTVLDLNQNVVLTTKNYEDKSITTEKLSPNIRLSAANVLETATKFFLTKNEKDKLDGIDYGATNYHHPETHPAKMIVEDDDRMFITKRKLDEIDMKPYARDVYTKDEIHTVVQGVYDTILDSSPETLDTLKELAEALGNDPNFATTVMTMLADKVNTAELEETNKVLDTKVNITDYTKAGIYGVPTRVRVLDVDHYNMRLEDPKFMEYIDGMLVTIKINETNLSECMLKINNLEPKPIVTQDQYPLIKNELKHGSIYSLRYNGSTGNFILLGKGGVNLHNTNPNERFVDIGESVIRGDLIDIINGKVRKSIPNFNLISSCDNLKNDLFNCTGDIDVISLSDTNFIVFWQEDKLLKSYMFNIDDNMNIIRNSATTIPLIINTDCKYFKVAKINNSKVVVTYSTYNNYINSLVISVNELDEFIIGNPYVTDELDNIYNLISMNISKNKIIIGYQVLDKTKTFYLEVLDQDIRVISNRTNANYPLDHFTFINQEQIAFVGYVGSSFKGWVMNIHDNEMSYTTLNDISNDSFTNITSVLLQDNNIYYTYTNIDENIMYDQYISISLNGDMNIQARREIS
ncbi:MAG: hypothetical protein ACRCXT_11950, partial [Paraclostridium sp.]